MELQGYVLLALALLLLGYLVPHLTHARQLVLDSRVEDRFSAGLRVLDHQGVARQTHSSGRGPALHTPSPEAPMTSPRLAAPGTAGSAPAGVGESARALAAARARRAARRANRAAAARRRLILTAALVLLSVASWTAVGLTALAWTVASIPTALVVAVLVQGRRVAIQGQQTDRRERALIERLEAQMQAAARASSVPGAARRTARSTTRTVEAPEAVGDEPAQGASTSSTSEQAPSAQTASAQAEPAPSASTPAGAVERRRPVLTTTTLTREPRRSVTIGAFQGTGEVPQVAPAPAAPVAPSADEPAKAPIGQAPQRPAAHAPQHPAQQWTPTPVPPPSYTLKPASQRREVAPYESGHIPQVSVPQRPMPGDMTASVSPAEAAAETAPPALDLNAVLARRRAAGA